MAINYNRASGMDTLMFHCILVVVFGLVVDKDSDEKCYK